MRVLRIFVRVAHLRSAQAIVGCTQRPITFADFFRLSDASRRAGVVPRFQGDNLSMDRFIDLLLLRAIITRQAHARTRARSRSCARLCGIITADIAEKLSACSLRVR